MTCSSAKLRSIRRPERKGEHGPMNPIPVDPESRSSSIENKLERIRDGQRAEEELIGHYLNTCRQKGSLDLAELKVTYRRAAERMGYDVLDLISSVLSDRFEEV